MSYQAVIENRVRDRLAACRESARRVVTALRNKGVSAALFGSTLRGDVHTESDVDILILDHPQTSRGVVLALAEEVATVKVDVLFSEDIKPDVLRKIRAQIDAA